MKLKSFSAEKTVGVRRAISLAITLVAIAMIVLGKILYSPASEWTFYAIPLLLAVSAAVIARQTLTSGAGNRKPSSRKISNGLVALSSAAILTVYAAGYDRTSVAADQFERQAASSRGRMAMAAGDAQKIMAAAISANVVSEKIPALSVPTVDVADKTADTSLDTSAVVPSPLPAVSPTPVMPADVPAVPVIAAPSQPVVTAAVDAPPAAEPAPENDSEYADGTFTGRGTSRHGDIEARIVVQGGRIVSASVSRCMTQYSCDVLRPAYRQLLSVQDPEKIDNITGATDSVDAYYGGVFNALTTSMNVRAFQREYKTTQ